MRASGDLFFYRGWFGDSLHQRCKLDLARPPSMTELATLAAFVGSLVTVSVGGVVLGSACEAPLLPLGAGFLSHEDRHLDWSPRLCGKRAWFRGCGWVGVCRGKYGKTLVPDLFIGVSALNALLASFNFSLHDKDFPHKPVGLIHRAVV